MHVHVAESSVARTCRLAQPRREVDLTAYLLTYLLTYLFTYRLGQPRRGVDLTARTVDAAVGVLAPAQCGIIPAGEHLSRVRRCEGEECACACACAAAQSSCACACAPLQGRGR